ncbi:hypothetical protein GW916_05035 [bacterium]|nr:hypothetical protein [bacterium]
MGKLFILVYVLVALLASGFAKANDFGVDSQINQVAFDQKELSFHISGESPNGCISQVIVADQTGPEGQTIKIKVLDVVSMGSGVYCTLQVTPFLKNISLFDLIQVSNLKIDPKQTYTIGVSNSPQTVEIRGAQLLSI